MLPSVRITEYFSHMNIPTNTAQFPGYKVPKKIISNFEIL
jgi:hypothetical protein